MRAKRSLKPLTRGSFALNPCESCFGFLNLLGCLIERIIQVDRVASLQPITGFAHTGSPETRKAWAISPRPSRSTEAGETRQKHQESFRTVQRCTGDPTGAKSFSLVGSLPETTQSEPRRGRAKTYQRNFATRPFPDRPEAPKPPGEAKDLGPVMELQPAPAPRWLSSHHSAPPSMEAAGSLTNGA